MIVSLGDYYSGQQIADALDMGVSPWETDHDRRCWFFFVTQVTKTVNSVSYSAENIKTNNRLHICIRLKTNKFKKKYLFFGNLVSQVVDASCDIVVGSHGKNLIDTALYRVFDMDIIVSRAEFGWKRICPFEYVEVHKLGSLQRNCFDKFMGEFFKRLSKTGT